MAHFARLDENNIVSMIVVVSNDDLIDANGNEVEQLGVNVCKKVIGPGPWIQTSYNGKFRKRYASIGYTYDAQRDAFIAPKPEDEKEYFWDNDSLEWVLVVTEETESKGE